MNTNITARVNYRRHYVNLDIYELQRRLAARPLYKLSKRKFYQYFRSKWYHINEEWVNKIYRYLINFYFHFETKTKSKMYVQLPIYIIHSRNTYIRLS